MPGIKPGMTGPMNDETDHKPHRGRKFRGKRLRTSLPKPEAEAPLPAPKEADRIAKVIARAGLASRREAEAWIEAGRVAVNGQVIRSPALNVGAGDRIAVDGKPLPTRERTRLWLFNKPRGLVTTNADPEGRPTIFGALSKTLPRVVTIGRLDMNTEGLLLLTNDGGLARALELPATGWLRRYRVRAYGEVLQPRLDALEGGEAHRGAAAFARDIELRHVRPGAAADIGDLDRHAQPVAAGDDRVAIGEAGVAEPVAEREQRLQPLLLVPAIADVGALLVIDREADRRRRAGRGVGGG